MGNVCKAYYFKFSIQVPIGARFSAKAVFFRSDLTITSFSAQTVRKGSREAYKNILP